ncbi:U-box domain-containing protein 43-like [Salvia miltiorrhiza]|uniref:U-box domain-containing protein 43-like n=1 Tax=Salvia miltiorrhiza TaxID=226208 RepID=UPI0025ABD2E5|nr:U-box domain-containing protein 43-like [Salvia miltiorrhiza]
MVMDVLINSSVTPLVEAASQIIEGIIEMVVASENVLVGKKSFVKLSSYLNALVPLLQELNRGHIAASEGIQNFIEILDHQVREGKKLIRDCSERSRFYLLVNSRSIAKHVEAITKEIIRAISCIPFASLNVSLKMRDDIEQLISNMQNAEFRAALAEEDILEKIESGIQERNVDRSYANDLLVSIAKAVGVPTDRSALKKEFDDFKSEIENLCSRKDKAEAIQMDQIIALLERADVASSLDDKEKKYLNKRNSLGVQPLEPLMSFYCPITREVMIDPVETPSGHTFERSAIEKWLSEADEPSCPITSNSLEISMLRPNKTLRQSIEEWRDRNNMIMVASLKSRLSSENEEEVIHCLGQVKDLCEQREIHKEWLILENYIPTLVKLLSVKNRDIRNQALRILCLLVKDNDDAKERIATVENSIEHIVQFLGRRIGERKSAVTLLLELSKCEAVRDSIGKVQGCMLLLVTMLSNTDPQAAGDAKNVLDNLSYSDDNVILMAKSNYFTYLLERLSSGSDQVKMRMAKTLGDMELTDHKKAALTECGVLDLLLDLVPHDDVEMKIVAVQALLNVSSLEKNGQEIIKKGAVRPLLDILYRQTSSQKLRELVAATVVNLALSTIAKEGSDSEPVFMLETGDDISELFSFSTMTVPALQQEIFRAFHAMCRSPSADTVKSKLRECSAVQTLFRLCEVDDVISLRANAVKLLDCLIKDADGDTVLEHVTQNSIESLLKILKTSNNEEETASALGTIASLPESSQISEWLLESPNLQTIFGFLSDDRNSAHQKPLVLENAVGAIGRLTTPTSLQLQKKVAEAGAIPLLVRLLETGTNLTVKRAATCLSHLSQSSLRLTRQISRRQSLWCFSALPEAVCPVHHGLCTIESSFCLVEASAVEPLSRALRCQDTGVCDAALDALLTLINDEMLQSGCKVLAEANTIPAMIKLISSPCASLQEKVMNCLERIFRLVEYKQKYGASAHMPLVDLTQRGNNRLRSLAARILAQLNVLHDQSSYF